MFPIRSETFVNADDPVHADVHVNVHDHVYDYDYDHVYARSKQL